MLRKDPLVRVKGWLIDKGWLSEEEDRDLKGRAMDEIEEAIQFARESPYPEKEEALRDVFV